MNDLSSYNETVSALNMLGFSEAEQNELFKIIAAILHLGNVSFVETIIEQENEQNQEGCMIDVSIVLMSETIFYKLLHYRI